MRVEKGKLILEETDEKGKLVLTKELRDNLIVENQGLVGDVIKKHFKYNMPFDDDDLFGYGVLGLTKAAYNYDPNKENKFSTYAYKKIWGEIKLGIRDKSGLIGSREERSKQSSRPPKPFSYYEDKVKKYRDSLGDNNTIGIDELSFDQNTLITESDSYDSILDREVIDKVLSFLTTRDRKIFNMYYLENLSQKEISKLIGLSQPHVSRVLIQIKDLFNYFKPVLV